MYIYFKKINDKWILYFPNESQIVCTDWEI